jgi:hypothetical protein
MFGLPRAVLRVKMLNEARHTTYSAWCQRQMRVLICGRCSKANARQRHRSAGHAWVRLPFCNRKIAGTFFAGGATLPGVIMDRRPCRFGAFVSGRATAFPTVTTPTCVEIRPEVFGRVQRPFCRTCCLVFGYKCQDRSYQAKKSKL